MRVTCKLVARERSCAEGESMITSVNKQSVIYGVEFIERYKRMLQRTIDVTSRHRNDREQTRGHNGRGQQASLWCERGRT